MEQPGIVTGATKLAQPLVQEKCIQDICQYQVTCYLVCLYVNFSFNDPTSPVGKKFTDRSEVSQEKLMLTWQSGMDGNRDAGCVAVFISEKTSYINELFYNKDGILEKVVMCGRGGRQKTEIGYVYVRNQEYHKNYPMLVSTQYGLPIRLIVEDKTGKITYCGLWKCLGYSYFPHNNSDNFKIYQFTLLPWNS